MGTHAYLAPSGAHRWMLCTASPAQEKGKPDRGSTYAEEGTRAHAWAQARLENVFHSVPLPDMEIDEDMKAHIDTYVERVMEIFNQAALEGCAPLVHVEERLEFEPWVPRSFGTADCIIEGGNTLHVIDLKYGKGVLVEAENNPQLMIYALGALDVYNWAEDIQKVKVHIIQPRLDHFDHAIYTTSNLTEWAQKTLKPKAAEAYTGPGNFAVGTHCQFCKAAHTCRVRRKTLKKEIEDAQKDRADIAYILEHASAWLSWIKGVQEDALERALEGEDIPGFKLVEGRSNRRITDPTAVAKILQDQGLDPYKPQELQTLTALEKLTGKKKFAELCSAYLVKPEGKPTLVPESDKRPELHSAQNEFSKIKGENENG